MENNDVKAKRLPVLKTGTAQEKDTKRKLLQEGYAAYGSFNAAYAEMCLEADNEVLASCEEKLSESE